ncbi:hypothetical protein, partial [uncultured Alistipes sp.]|uniref:hypothetical protein n=1 Tax=uncultured Alistipes sp. TaxID=538949 RepID=UPI002804E58A
LRAPCSAAARTLPRRTTCGGFWYFWPQKYRKKGCASFRASEILSRFSEQKPEKLFLPAFRWRKAAKTTRRFSIFGIKPGITPGNYDLKPDNPGCEMKIAQS